MYCLGLVELREAFEAEAQEILKQRLLLTAAVPVGPDNVRSGYDVPAVASYLDFINLMAYDFHGVNVLLITLFLYIHLLFVQKEF